ncbi:MAG: hypothetical protein AABX38_06320 [Candidatus Micrarchaeota archaeon]
MTIHKTNRTGLSLVPNNSSNPSPQSSGKPMADKNKQTVKMSRAEIIAILKQQGRNWNDEVADVLKIPEFAYVLDESETSRLLLISSENNLDIVRTVANAVTISGGSFPKEIPKYGIALTGVGSYTYLVFIDREKRVVDVEVLFSLHAKQRDQDWQDIAQKVKDAITEASKNQKGVLVTGATSRRIAFAQKE